MVDRVGERIAWWLLLALLALLPLVFAPTTIEVYILPKAGLLWVLAFGAAALVVLSDLQRGLVRVVEKPGGRALAGLCIAAVGATVLSPIPFVSLLGAFTRREGLLTLLSYVLIYVLVLRLATTERRVTQCLWALVLPVVPTAVYAAAQALGFEFARELNPTRAAVRAFGALGNADLLGVYAALMLPVLTAIFLRWRGGRRTYVGAAIFADIAALLLSYYRGAWLGAAIGMAAMVSLVGMPVLRRRLKELLLVLGILGLAVLVALGVRTLKGASPVPESFAGRAASIVRVSEGTAATRLEVWPRALGLVARRPLLGFGPESFRGQFMPIRGKRIVKLEGTARWDRPHNSLLYLATSVGLVGLAFCVSFLAAALAAVIKARHVQDATLALGLVAGAIGGLASEFFVLSGPSTTPLILAVLGLAVASADLCGHESVTWREVRVPPIAAVVAAALIMIILLGVSWAAAESFLGDYYADIGRAATSRGDETQAIGAWDRSVAHAWWINDYRWRAALGWERAGLRSANYAYLARGAEILRDGLKIDPFDEEAHILLGEIYRYMATLTGRRTMALAARSYRKALRLDPWSPAAHGGLARVLYLQGDYRGAVAQATAALEFDSRNADLLYWMGWSYVRLGNARQARVSFERALRLDPTFGSAREALQQLGR